MNTTEQAARHVATTAGPAARASQKRVYQKHDAESKTSLLEGAADVLLLLALHPLSGTARIGFTALLDRRIRRAYGGQGHG
jgi:hypothetical protein